MDYFELNPIIEEDSTDSEKSDIYPPQFQISLEDPSDNQENPFLALLRQESVKSRYEFSRQESQTKPKQQVIDTFPSIRGLEHEQLKVITIESPGLGRRPSTHLKSMSDSLKNEAQNFEKEGSLKITIEEESKSLNSEGTNDKFFSRGTSKRTKTFNAVNNIDELRNIINSKIMSPELMLVSAIGGLYDIDVQSKKKDNYLIELALEQLEATNSRFNQKFSNQEDLYEDFHKLENFLSDVQQETTECEDQIKEINKNYAENRGSLENRLKLTHQKIYVAVNSQEKLNYNLRETIEKYKILEEEKLSEEETWKMYNEDMLTQLYAIRKKTQESKKQSYKLQSLLLEISEEQAKKKMLKNKIKICTDSLCEVAGYINDNNLKKNFSAEFFELISNIRNEILAALDAEKEFQNHAITDPKTIMPYHRASDTNYR